MLGEGISTSWEMERSPGSRLTLSENCDVEYTGRGLFGVAGEAIVGQLIGFLEHRGQGKQPPDSWLSFLEDGDVE